MKPTCSQPKPCSIFTISARVLPRFFDGADEQGSDDKMHDGSGGDHPGTARAGSHAPRQIASHSGPETNLPRRLLLAFVSLTVGPHLQGLQALQLKKTPHADHCS